MGWQVPRLGFVQLPTLSKLQLPCYTYINKSIWSLFRYGYGFARDWAEFITFLSPCITRRYISLLAWLAFSVVSVRLDLYKKQRLERRRTACRKSRIQRNKVRTSKAAARERTRVTQRAAVALTILYIFTLDAQMYNYICAQLLMFSRWG